MGALVQPQLVPEAIAKSPGNKEQKSLLNLYFPTSSSFFLAYDGQNKSLPTKFDGNRIWTSVLDFNYRSFFERTLCKTSSFCSWVFSRMLWKRDDSASP